MITWRLAPRRFATVLDGGVNRQTDAQWNSGNGRGVVYTSLGVATCVLEVFVHLGPQLRARLPASFVLVRLEVPDDAGVRVIDAVSVPEDADTPDGSGRSRYQRAGVAWLKVGEHLALIAPSAVVPYERNVMLNPDHPRMRDVRIVSAESFRFDARLAIP